MGCKIISFFLQQRWTTVVPVRARVDNPGAARGEEEDTDARDLALASIICGFGQNTGKSVDPEGVCQRVRCGAGEGPRGVDGDG